jgi:hypothetical protein
MSGAGKGPHADFALAQRREPDREETQAKAWPPGTPTYGPPPRTYPTKRLSLTFSQIPIGEFVGSS